MSTNRQAFLTVECKEPEGTFQRNAYLCELSTEKLRYFYTKLSPFKVLFNEEGSGDVDAFISGFITIDGSGKIEPNGLIIEIDDVGLVRFSDIVPNHSAEIHVAFWDRRFRGRENLMRQLVKHAMELFNLHRVETRVPLYATSFLKHPARCGFTREARLRGAALFDGKFFDVYLYSILRNEV